MKNQLLHTPEGVRDIYNGECARKQALEKRMLDKLHSYGYRDIETPAFEFFDVFGKEVGTVPSKDLYKFFDREGHTLVLRPDITPSIARAASKYYSEEDLPVRLCYKGNTFINNSSYQGRLKETTQIGAEFIGDNSAQADAEAVALVTEVLLAAGLTEFQVSLGHVEFFRSICREAGFDREVEEELRQLISNKNIFGVEELLDDQNLDSRQKKLFSRLPQMFGGVHVLDEALSMTDNPGAVEAVKRLKTIYEHMKVYGFEKYLSFDLGMLNKYMYYTGIIFRGYTFGTGQAVVKGGRYDHLLGHFGKEAPAVGFVAVADQLLTALSRQDIDLPMPCGPKLLLYKEGEHKAAIGMAKKLRGEGADVALMEEKRPLSEIFDYAKRNGFSEVLAVREDGPVSLSGKEGA